MPTLFVDYRHIDNESSIPAYDYVRYLNHGRY